MIMHQRSSPNTVQEYDSVMLETYELRNALRTCRKELAQSLYQHDAACRTIARLQQEKEAAEKKLEDLQAQVAAFKTQRPAGAEGPSEGPPAKRVRARLPGSIPAAAYRAEHASCCSTGCMRKWQACAVWAEGRKAACLDAFGMVPCARGWGMG
jgi:hypothetical protein